ncbi:hypothetical protein EEDFHM_02788 [Methylorubrum populi]
MCLAFQEPQGGVGIRRLDHRQSRILQHVHGDHAHETLILHHEDVRRDGGIGGVEGAGHDGAKKLK